MATKKQPAKKTASKTVSVASAKSSVSAKSGTGKAKSATAVKKPAAIKNSAVKKTAALKTVTKKVSNAAKPAKKSVGKSAKSSEKTVTKATKATKTTKSTATKATASAKPKTEPKAKAEKKPAASVKTAAPKEEKAAKPKAEKKTPAPKETKSSAKGKAGKAAKTASSSSSSESTRVTVKIGAGRPVLSIAPGVMINRRPDTAVTEEKDASKMKKLTKKEVEEIRVMLEQKRDELLYGIRKELKNSRQRSVNASADPMDKATDSSDDDLSFEIASASDEELSDIQVALKKIEDGTYGECESCGCAIGVSRLRVLPFAIHCRDCRNLKERISRREDTAYGTFIGDGDGEGEGSEEE